jgi:DNA-binding transcriptional regulator YiaG
MRVSVNGMKFESPKMTPDELKRIRATLENTQAEMGQALGVALRSYQQWEGGERSIPGPAVLLARRLLADKQKSS